MSKKVCLLLTLVILMNGANGQSLFYVQDSLKQMQWVDSVFSSMTFEERLGQLFMVAAYSNRDEQHYQDIELLIRQYNIGGLIFFQGGPVRQAMLTNRYQEAARVPLLIAIDGEWGLSMRLDSTVSYPKQITLGAIQDNRYIYNMGAEIARQMKIMGIHVNFAPVVDVNSNPANPVIGFRSFGENKYNVAEKGVAYMKGMQDNGVIANAKHFPGHGDTDADSHYTLPVIKHSQQRLDSMELYPFKKLIDDGIRSMMVAHIHIPAYDDTPNLATTLSEKVVDGLLKNKLGFEGLIFTDALNMQGVAKFYKPGEVDLKALLAGNDVLLFPENVPAAVKAIKRAVDRRLISQEEVDQRIKKILAAKYWAGLHKPQRVNTDNLIMRLNNSEAHLVKQKLYEQAVTVASNEEKMIPVRSLDTTSFASLAIGAESQNVFQRVLGKYAPFTHYQLHSRDKRAEKRATLLNQLKNYDYVVVGVHGIKNYPGGAFGLDLNDIVFLKSLQQKTKVVVTTFGNPYSLKHFEGFKNVICAYEDDDMMHAVVPQVIFGALPAKGKLPVTASASFTSGSGVDTEYLGRLGYALPEDVGIDSRMLLRIDEIAEEAISEGATPGCQVLVAKSGKVIFEKAYGYLSYDRIDPVTDETVYDVASITKVAATLQAIMFLVDKGVLDLDKKASYYLPELKKTNKKNLELRDILTHQAGLIPFIPHWKNTVDDFGILPQFYHLQSDSSYISEVAQGIYGIYSLPDSLWKWTLDSDLLEKSKKKEYEYRYSDLGFYILYRLAETLLNQRLPDFLNQNFYKPLGLATLGFNPLCYLPIEKIAPTEEDAYFRKQLIRGTVHDPGAAMCGGVAGHAGLFSTARDLATLLQMNLQDGYYGGVRYFTPGIVGQFTSKQFDENRRGLGWDKPSFNEDFDVTSRFASPDTFGHTGFTGTAAWVDPEFDLIYIFLSNRIHPDANNIKLIKDNVRTRIHDAIYEAMWDYRKYYIP